MLHREAQFGRGVRQQIIAKAGFYQSTDQLGECADFDAKQSYEENENNGPLEEYECVANQIDANKNLKGVSNYYLITK